MYHRSLVMNNNFPNTNIQYTNLLEGKLHQINEAVGLFMQDITELCNKHCHIRGLLNYHIREILL